MSSDTPLLEVENLETQFTTDRGTVRAVNDVSFSLDRGETFGIVGESGAGKSVTALSVMRLVESPGRIVGGEVRYKGADLLSMSESEIRDLRGEEIAMIFQDPMTALNPAYTVGEQIIDVILEHKDVSKQQARSRAIDLLDDVGIPDPGQRIDDFPHQFSGGMRQRAMIAMALSCNPDLLIADEPTTALDVTIQAQILDLLSELQEEYDTAILLITHNMGVVAEVCDRVAVMYAGEKIEEAPVEQVFTAPRHPYTVGLFKSIPRIDDPRVKLDTIEGSMPDLIDTPSGCSFRERCPHATDECAEINPGLREVSDGVSHTSACHRIEDIDFEQESQIARRDETPRERSIGDVLLDAQDLQKYFDPESQEWYDKLLGREKYVHAVDGVSFQIRQGETVGLVGESGCGKSTLGRTILQLYEPDEGTVLYAGSDLTEMGRNELKSLRSDLQIVFQDPFSSLNPRKTVLNIIGRPLEIHGKVDDRDEKRERVVELLEQVGLEESHLNRYPHEFSGGQKQRIGIARALAVEPDFIVADEPVSALDVSVQAQILNILMDLQDDLGLTYLFIAHDLNVVQHISDRIAVMYLGEIVESGTVEAIFEPPYHPYTEALLSAIPQPNVTDETDDRIFLDGDVPSPIDPPSGCRFHTRCPYAMEECATEDPPTFEIADGPVAKCHLFDEELMSTKEEAVRGAVTSQKRIVSSGEAIDQSAESE